MLNLLKKGVPWDVIQEFTEDEVSLVLGIDSAVEQKQADDQAHSMPNIPSMPNF